MGDKARTEQARTDEQSGTILSAQRSFKRSEDFREDAKEASGETHKREKQIDVRPYVWEAWGYARLHGSFTVRIPRYTTRGLHCIQS